MHVQPVQPGGAGLKVVVYARTSGDEADTGQDVVAQGKHTSDKAKEAGHEVVAVLLEDGVSGGLPASERRVWQKAVARAEAEGAAILVREVSRFSRFAPHGAMVELDQLPVAFVSLKEPHFEDTGKSDPALLLLRFVSLWQAWSELQGIQAKTQAAMDDLASGRRATKSGKAVGRPERMIAPEHLAAARLVLAAPGGSLSQAHAKVLELRGWAPTLDPRTAKPRFVGKETLRRALSTQNPSPPKTLDDLRGGTSNLNGPVVGRSDQAESGAVVAGVQPLEPVEPVGGQVIAKGPEAA